MEEEMRERKGRGDVWHCLLVHHATIINTLQLPGRKIIMWPRPSSIHDVAAVVIYSKDAEHRAAGPWSQG
jgi:hypothetical protein